ncbi:MAG TPA: formate dehydrogenase accessory sulfurtransferase FdhD [Gammaproteobacteria bacterium]|nr:formate dehydrogenase accessory sulfurtransferase FdhD [Gammaproteobacteria bacterium]
MINAAPRPEGPELEGDSSPVRLLRFEAGKATFQDDMLATEEALEIHVAGTAPVITMRTPGHDLELAAGLLLSEGLVQHRNDIAVLEPVTGAANAVGVLLKSFTDSKAALLRRSSLSNSACGVCGKDKLNLEPMHSLPPLPAGPLVSPELLYRLPQKLRAAQGIFEHTGGLHAAALFDANGDLQAVREDVGRHNAMDKLNGWALLNDRLPLYDHIVLLSGRASFELLQKCIMARVPIVCAISAPSSYAVRLAREFGVTLVGFLRGERFNVYSAPERIVDSNDEARAAGIAST